MANKQILSVVAASVLAASFTFTGCGSSSSSSGTPSSSTPSSSSSSDDTNQTSSSSSSIDANTTIVKVTDANVLLAMVTAGGVEYDHEVGNGEYEFFASPLAGALLAEGGVNDVNGNGEAETGEPMAPTMKAPEGYMNINPFTTMLVDGVADMATTYPAAAGVAADFDFDVVTAGAANLDVAKEVAKAALTLSAEQNGGGVGASSSDDASSSDASTGVLPDEGQTDDTVSSSSADASSSSVGGGVLPDEAPMRGILPDEGDTDDTVVSSSSTPASSSSTGILPDEGESSSESSEGGYDLSVVFAAIDACADTACIDAALAAEMATLNGTYTAPASSSSSEDETCLPGQSCDEASSSSTDDREAECVAGGGTWIEGVCLGGTAPSSSSVADSGSSSSVPVLPGQ